MLPFAWLLKTAHACVGWRPSELRRSLRVPAGLIEIPQGVPVVLAAAVVVTPGRNRATGKLHDKRRAVGVGAIPGAGIQDPARAATAPRDTGDDREPVIHYPLVEVKRDVAIVL